MSLENARAVYPLLVNLAKDLSQASRETPDRSSGSPTTTSAPAARRSASTRRPGRSRPRSSSRSRPSCLEKGLPDLSALIIQKPKARTDSGNLLRPTDGWWEPYVAKSETTVGNVGFWFKRSRPPATTPTGPRPRPSDGRARSRGRRINRDAVPPTAERAVTPIEPIPDPTGPASAGRRGDRGGRVAASDAVPGEDGRRTTRPTPSRRRRDGPTLAGPAARPRLPRPAPRGPASSAGWPITACSRLIGEGGMGLVFQADDTHLRRPVALKVIRPELADAAGGRGAVPPRGPGRGGDQARPHRHHLPGRPAARRRLPGDGVPPGDRRSRAWLERGQGPSVDLALRIGREVASGLAAAHAGRPDPSRHQARQHLARGPHGPGQDPRLRPRPDGPRGRPEITDAGAIMGTPAYMSPGAGSRRDGRRLVRPLQPGGCVLYRLLAGRLPFEGRTILAVLTALATETPPPPRVPIDPDVPPALDDLVMRLLAKAPADRPPSAQAVVDAIRAIERQLAADRQVVEISSLGISISDDAPKATDPAAKPSGPSRLGGLRRSRGLVWGSVRRLSP